ncbi:MAG: ABC transporter ATP-binding protein [Planctomycetota bacterium]
MAIIIFLSLLGAASGLLAPVLTEKLIDDALAPPFNSSVLLWIAVAVGVNAVVAFAVRYAQGLQATIVATRVLIRMRSAFFGHLQRVALSFFTRTKIGEVLTRMNRDLAEIETVATGALPALVTSLFTIVGTLFLLIHYSPVLTAISCLAFPLSFLVARGFRKLVMSRTRDIRDSNEKLGTFLVENLEGMKTVRASGALHSEAKSFSGLQGELKGRVLSLFKVTALGGGLPRLLVTAAAIAVFLEGGRRVIAGQLELGDLIAFSMLQTRVHGPLQGLTALYLQVQRAMVSVDRVFEYLDLPAEDSADDFSSADAHEIKGAVAASNLSFAYEANHPVLKEVSFAIAAGERVGIAGRSGSGKSTLVDLMLRLLRPLEGQVLIDGEDLAKLSRGDYLRQVGLVSQEPFLFHRSLRDNLLFAAPDASEADLLAALKLTGADPLLDRLREGLDTMIGPRGTRLSGGEKQRISMARAFLRNPKILILDEATSHLDWESEDQIASAMDELMRGRTVILITHRLPTMARLDRVLFLDDARIVAEGSHAQLLAECPAYAQLAREE